jgi:hypothetical protein
MKTTILKTGFIALGLFSVTTLTAQRYDESMSYTVDTLRNKPRSNKLMINAGVQGDADYNGAGSGYYGAYAHGRFNIGRFLQVGGTFVMPFTDAPKDRPDYKYSIMEAQAALFFSDKTEKEKHDFTLGHGSTKDGRVKFHAALPIPKSVQLGLCGGMFNWTRPFVRGQKDTAIFDAVNISDGRNVYKDNIYTNVSVTGFSAGFALSTNLKAKYRFNTVKMTSRGNIKHGKTTVRRNTSVDLAMEFLFAPSVRFQENVNVVQNDTAQTYFISNLQKKHMGFRVRAEIRKSIFSVRFEMGVRPGVKYAMGGNGNKTLSGAYYTLGLGIGIGAL